MNFLIWDFDGTLATRKGAWTGALAEVLAQAGILCEREQLRPFIQSGFPWHSPAQVRPAGESSDEWWKRLEPVFANAFVSGAGVPAELAQRLAPLVRAAYVAPQQWGLFDDSLDALNDLAQSGWQHILLSNHVPELPEILDSLAIATHFDRVFNSAITGIEKPNAKAFQNVLSQLPTERNVWMIGDNMSADIRGAEAHGIFAVLVRGTHPDASLSCHSLTELSRILRLA